MNRFPQTRLHRIQRAHQGPQVAVERVLLDKMPEQNHVKLKDSTRPRRASKAASRHGERGPGTPAERFRGSRNAIATIYRPGLSG